MARFYPFKVQKEGSDVRHFLDHRDTIYQNPAPLKTLSSICLDTIIKHPPLVEECSPSLPQELREQMIVRCFEERRRDLLVPLFRTWSKPSIAFRQLFPRCVYSFPLSVFRYLNENDAYDFKRFFKNTVLHLIKERIINIDQETVNAVKLVDLTGTGTVRRDDIKNLLSVPFTATDSVTLKVDICIEDNKEWMQVLQGNQHIQIKINFVVLPHSFNQLLSLMKEEDLMGIQVYPGIVREDFILSKVTSTFSRFEKTIRCLGLVLPAGLHDNEPGVTLNTILRRFEKLTTLSLYSAPGLSLSTCLQDLRLENLTLETHKLEIEDHQLLFGMKGLKQLSLESINLSEVDVEALIREKRENLDLEVLHITSYHYRRSSGDQLFNIVDFLQFFKALNTFILLEPSGEFCLDFDKIDSIFAMNIPRVVITFEKNDQLNQNQRISQVMKEKNYNYYTEDFLYHLITIGAWKASKN